MVESKSMFKNSLILLGAFDNEIHYTNGLWHWQYDNFSLNKHFKLILKAIVFELIHLNSFSHL